MNLYRIAAQLRVAYFALRLGRLLGLHRLAKQIRGSIAHRRIVAFWLVAALAFAVPWGWLFYSERTGSTGDLCRVLRVVDGDGVRLDCGPGRENLNVRLYCIDAPETEQEPWGELSTKHLANLVGPSVFLIDHGTDRWRRTIGQVFTPAGEDLNLRMVQDGWAPVYPQYCADQAYYRAQSEAKEAKRGVWSAPGLHQEPWEWR